MAPLWDSILLLKSCILGQGLYAMISMIERLVINFVYIIFVVSPGMGPIAVQSFFSSVGYTQCIEK